MSEYIEPKLGDYVIVSSVEEGDEMVLRTHDVYFDVGLGATIVRTDDGSKWAAETGMALTRIWRGRTIRVERANYMRNKIGDRLADFARKIHDVDEATLARVYDFILREVKP